MGQIPEGGRAPLSGNAADGPPRDSSNRRSKFHNSMDFTGRTNRNAAGRLCKKRPSRGRITLGAPRHGSGLWTTGVSICRSCGRTGIASPRPLALEPWNKRRNEPLRPAHRPPTLPMAEILAFQFFGHSGFSCSLRARNRTRYPAKAIPSVSGVTTADRPTIFRLPFDRIMRRSPAIKANASRSPSLRGPNFKSSRLTVNGGAKRDHLGGVRRDRLAAAGLSP